MNPKKKSRRVNGCLELLIWNIPESIKTKFKTKCAQKGVTMRNAVIEMIEKFIKND